MLLSAYFSISLTLPKTVLPFKSIILYVSSNFSLIKLSVKPYNTPSDEYFSLPLVVAKV